MHAKAMASKAQQAAHSRPPKKLLHTNSSNSEWLEEPELRLPLKRDFSTAFSDGREITVGCGEALMDEGLTWSMGRAKKRCKRLSVEQVTALERAFGEDNKLEAARKVVLARELGLQARQVAVWFQNRRARYKTKQMESDLDGLRKEMESMKADRDELVKEKDKLEAKVLRLKGHISRLEIITESVYSTSSNSTMLQIQHDSISNDDNCDYVENVESSITEESAANSRAEQSPPSIHLTDAWDLLDLPNLNYWGIISNLS